MLTPDRVISALAAAEELERAVQRHLESDAHRESYRECLSIFRHAHALRMALERWQEQQRP